MAGTGQPPSVLRLELPNEAELGTVAFVVLGLGVGGLDLIDQHHLWAEAQNGQSPIEHSDAQRPGAIYPVPAVPLCSAAMPQLPPS